jgi:hypothetical protein
MEIATTQIDEVNFAMHPLTNPYDWYEREFLRMVYKMQKLAADEATRRPRAPPTATLRPPRKRRSAPSENV